MSEGLSTVNNSGLPAIDLGSADINTLTAEQEAEHREFDQEGLFEEPKDRVDFVRACMRENTLAAAATIPAVAVTPDVDWRSLARGDRGGKRKR